MIKIRFLPIIILLLTNYCIGQNANFQQSTFPYTDKICFTKEYKEYIKIADDVDVTKLYVQDQLRFIRKSYISNGYFQTDQR